MSSIVVIAASAGTSLLATERANARRMQTELNELRNLRLQDGAARQTQNPETVRQNQDARRSVATAFAANRALTARLAQQSISDAGGEMRPEKTAGVAGNSQPGANTASANSASVNASGAKEVSANSAADAAQRASEKEKTSSPIDLNDEEKQLAQEMKARDREVRAHERAHKAVGGRYAGAASFTYQKGPDGQRYAVGGEVPIDMSTESSPEATIQKMTVVMAAALAPAEPSGQDVAVAQMAQSQRSQAIAAARQETQSELQPDVEETQSSSEGAAAAGVVSRKEENDAAAKAQSNPYEQFRAANDQSIENILYAVA
jgi:SprA family protein